MRFGRAASAIPLARDFGESRGTPIDRFYIERFVSAHAHHIHGRVLEIGEDKYSRRFGKGRVTHQDIHHLDHDFAGATITGDLAQTGVLPDQSFDCIILTQTLHLIFDMDAALRQLRAALKPGGTMLITVPGITPIDLGRWRENWCWSLTDISLRRLLDEAFGRGNAEVTSFGNLFAATAFLHNAAVEEVGRSRLEPFDPAYPVTVAARAWRPR